MILKLYIFGVDHIFAQWQAANTELVAQLIHHPENKEILHSNMLADTCHWCSKLKLYLFWSDHIFAQWQAANTGPWWSGFLFLMIATRETEESTET